VTGGADLDIFVARALSRGAFPLLLLSLPVARLLWAGRGRARRAAALAVMALAIVAATAFEVEANLLSVLVGLAFAGFAALRPRTALQTLCYGAAGALIALPLLLPLFRVLPETGFVSSLPFSWEWRLQIWAEIARRVPDAFFFGHGLDVMHVLEPTMTIRGYTLSTLPLHAHNFAFQIWFETGAIGALFWIAVLVLLARAIGRRTWPKALASDLAFIAAAWLTTVSAGFGLWQEWHHGALAIAVALAFLGRAPAPLASNLRPSP